MNDLERDLHELFDQRARDVDPAGLAPESVLRRGRRRQARTVIGGALAGVVVLAVAMAAVGSVQHSANVTPGGSNDLPVRTTNIGGVPVTAPAGWTLIDDWPLAAQVVTSTQCVFVQRLRHRGRRKRVARSPTRRSPSPRSRVRAEPVSPAPALRSSSSRTSSSHWCRPSAAALCDKDAGPRRRPRERGRRVRGGVTFRDPKSSADASDTCPQEPATGLGPWTMTQFGLGSADRPIRLTMAAIFLAGPECRTPRSQRSPRLHQQPLRACTSHPRHGDDPDRAHPVMCSPPVARTGRMATRGGYRVVRERRPADAGIDLRGHRSRLRNGQGRRHAVQLRGRRSRGRSGRPAREPSRRLHGSGRRRFRRCRYARGRLRVAPRPADDRELAGPRQRWRDLGRDAAARRAT